MNFEEKNSSSFIYSFFLFLDFWILSMALCLLLNTGGKKKLKRFLPEGQEKPWPKAEALPKS